MDQTIPSDAVPKGHGLTAPAPVVLKFSLEACSKQHVTPSQDLPGKIDSLERGQFDASGLLKNADGTKFDENAWGPNLKPPVFTVKGPGDKPTTFKDVIEWKQDLDYCSGNWIIQLNTKNDGGYQLTVSNDGVLLEQPKTIAFETAFRARGPVKGTGE